MVRFTPLFHRIRCSQGAAAVAAVAGALAYLLQSLWFAHHLPTLLEKAEYHRDDQ